MGVIRLGKGFVKKVFSVVTGLALVGVMSVSSVDAAETGTSGGVELTNQDVTPFASKKVGGGTWEYGTKKSGGYKIAYSYYWHPKKTHGASAQVGASSPARACVAKNKVARAEKKRKSKETAYVYWNTTCKLKK